MRLEIIAYHSAHLQDYQRYMDLGGSALSQVKHRGVSSAII